MPIVQVKLHDLIFFLKELSFLQFQYLQPCFGNFEQRLKVNRRVGTQQNFIRAKDI